MGEPRGRKLRVTLRSVQILDDKEPFFKKGGEFRFSARVHSRNNGGITVETTFPEKGSFQISDAPGHNRMRLDLPLFEGYVEDHLAIELTGTELDTIGDDDELGAYRRVFTGSPDSWIGAYGPGDETIEPEDVGDWRVWYQIEPA